MLWLVVLVVRAALVVAQINVTEINPSIVTLINLKMYDSVTHCKSAVLNADCTLPAHCTLHSRHILNIHNEKVHTCYGLNYEHDPNMIFRQLYSDSWPSVEVCTTRTLSQPETCRSTWRLSSSTPVHLKNIPGVLGTTLAPAERLYHSTPAVCSHVWVRYPVPASCPNDYEYRKSNYRPEDLCVDIVKPTVKPTNTEGGGWLHNSLTSVVLWMLTLAENVSQFVVLVLHKILEVVWVWCTSQKMCPPPVKSIRW